VGDSEPLTSIYVNGERKRVDVDPSTPLMYVLRNDLGLKGVRTGCSIGECGACRVIVDGAAVASCLTPVSEVADAAITTPEGLGRPGAPHPVQQSFIDEQAGQCGYCVNGMIMSVAARLEKGPVADTDELRNVLDEHLCRCGTHGRMLKAACRAAGQGCGQVPVVLTEPSSDEAADLALPAAVSADPQISTWLEFGADGRLRAFPGKVELGQGVRTAFAQIVAAQLDLPIDHVEVVGVRTDRSPDQGNTSGSFSIEHGGTTLAMAAVALRRVLVSRAAEVLGCAPGDVTLTGGDAADQAGHRVSISELATQAPVTERIEVTDQPRWTGSGLGRDVHRPDLAVKLTGAGAYVHDLAFDGMLHARALLPPDYDARPVQLDVDAAARLPGVQKIFQDDRIVIVMADREEQAIRAVRRLGLDTQWKPGTTISTQQTAELLRELPAHEHVRRRDDDLGELLASSRTHSASYSRPYQAHGPMSPSAAVARLEGRTIRVWTHSQGVFPLRRELAVLLDMGEEDVILEHLDGPGCYGMNGADDAAVFAALAARAVPGRPVRFQFSIADEFGWEPYGPGMVADLHAGIDDDGVIRAWQHRTITDSHSTRPNGDGDRLMAAWLGSAGRSRPWVGLGEPGLRNAQPIYDIPAMDISSAEVRGPLRTGPLRSLGAFHNVFAGESFMDELAELAAADPVEFRLRHLRDERAARVLEVAAETVDWQHHVGPSGRGLGVALARYKDVHGYAAEVAEVRIDTETGELDVVRLVVVCDVGTVINPDGLRNQLEGGAIQGLSRAMFEELQLSETGVHERDWTTYRSIRFAAVPTVDVVLVDRPGLPPLGAGEVSTPLVPAALANAVDDAVGIRVRDLPVTAERIRQRLEEMTDDELGRVLL
jgi:CO/xanthine dehydrogenase Mo-binding subunit/aerobic-type carbon monoxide dehydrogenase small subunit (CoxS/CutS family)